MNTHTGRTHTSLKSSPIVPARARIAISRSFAQAKLEQAMLNLQAAHLAVTCARTVRESRDAAKRVQIAKSALRAAKAAL